MRHLFQWVWSRRWLRKTIVISLGLSLILLLLGLVARTFLNNEDRKFQEFRQTGVGINKWLKSFGLASSDAVKSRSLDGIEAYYAADYRAPHRGNWALVKALETNGLWHAKLDKVDNAEFDRNGAIAYWRKYLAGIASVDHFECKINLLEDAQPGKSARVSVKYMLDGIDQNNRVIADRFFFRWWLKATGDGSGWEVVKEELLDDPEVSSERVAGDGAGFKSIDLVAAGIEYKHQRDPNLNPKNTKLKFAVIEHASGGVATADFDGDGWVDIFFCDGLQSRLYRNLKKTPDAECRFEDVTSRCGLSGIGSATCALFADIDNDGDKDLFVGRYGAPSRLFINDGHGTFSDHSSELGLDFIQPSAAACFIDYDRDGFVDLYVGNNGDAVHEVPRIPFFARNGRPNRLYHNIGGKKFEDVTEKAGVGDTGWTLAVCAGDVNGDGWPDIGVANDFGRKGLYRNNKDGTFTEYAKEAGTLDFSGGMGIAMGDLDGDGLADIYTSNIYSNQRWIGEQQALLQYVRNSVRSEWIFKDFREYVDIYRLTDGDWRALGRNAGEGNSLFCNKGDGTFRERKDSTTNRAGWGWGIALLDVDNDMDLDIYAANGWITPEDGGKSKPDL